MWEKLKPFPTKSKKEARVSTFPILIQHSAEIPNQSSNAGERYTRVSNKEGRGQIVPICR
jgi:hypothetical protein